MVYKLLTLLAIWAMWKLVASAWVYRYRCGYAIYPIGCHKGFHDRRLPSRRFPFVDHRDFTRKDNFYLEDAAHVFGMCRL